MFSASGCNIISIIVRHLRTFLLFVAITNARAMETTNIIVAAGTDVRISCTVNSNEPVLWETTPFGKSRSQPVYDGKQFVNNFSESGRFTLDNSSRPGCPDLLISSVELNDAGSFFCIESKKQFSDLIVTDEIACTEKDPSSRRMGENEFGIRQSILAFECKLNFRGNKRPVFCWFLNDDPIQGTSTSPIADPNSTIASGESNSVVAVKKLNRVVVAVKAVVSTDTSSDQCSLNSTNVHWKSEPLDIKFAALANHPVKECPDVDSSLICNPPCTYEQMERDDGSHYCQSNYALDEKNYNLQVNSSSCRPTCRYDIVSIAVPSALLGILFVIVVVVGLLCHFKEKIRRMFSSKKTGLRRVDGQPNVAQMQALLRNNDDQTQQ